RRWRWWRRRGWGWRRWRWWRRGWRRRWRRSPADRAGSAPDRRARFHRPRVGLPGDGGRVPRPRDLRSRTGAGRDDDTGAVSHEDRPRPRRGKLTREADEAAQPAADRRVVELRQARGGHAPRDRRQLRIQRVAGAVGVAGVAVTGDGAKRHRRARRVLLVPARPSDHARQWIDVAEV